jgi:hypothetical protein
VQRPERQVARFRDAERRLHGLEVAHLADEHDIGVLAESRTERVGETLRILMHLTLIDETALVLVHELDWVSVVDLPLPVGPVTRISPRGFWARVASTGGRASSWKARIRSGISRYTAPTAPRWWNMLQRNRPTPEMPKEKSSSRFSSNRFFCASVRTL